MGAHRHEAGMFETFPVNEIAAILPNKEAVRAAIEDLETANVDISTIRVLHAEGC